MGNPICDNGIPQSAVLLFVKQDRTPKAHNWCGIRCLLHSANGPKALLLQKRAPAPKGGALGMTSRSAMSGKKGKASLPLDFQRPEWGPKLAWMESLSRLFRADSKAKGSEGMYQLTLRKRGKSWNNQTRDE